MADYAMQINDNEAEIRELKGWIARDQVITPRTPEIAENLLTWRQQIKELKLEIEILEIKAANPGWGSDDKIYGRIEKVRDKHAQQLKELGERQLRMLELSKPEPKRARFEGSHSSFGTISYPEFYVEIKNDKKLINLVMPQLPNPTAPPAFWKTELQAKEKKEIPTQKRFHTLLDAENPAIFPYRIFQDGTLAGNKHLPGSTIPDGWVFEVGHTATDADALLIVEWKAPSVSLGNFEKGQACNDGLKYLKHTGRLFVWVLLSNFIEFVFFRVEEDPEANSFIFYETDALNTDNGFAHLHALLSKPPAELGAFNIPIIPDITVGKLLGRGVTSYVYAGQIASNKTQVAVKWVSAQYNDEATKEVEILRKLGNPSKGIPVIPLNDDPPLGIVVLSPVLSPVLALVRRNSMSLSRHHVKGLIEALRHVHDSGYFHRDVRPANVMCNGADFFLVDFGFAISKDEKDAAYRGTQSTASDVILSQKRDDVDNFEFREHDDVESLVKTVYLLCFPAAYDRLPPKNSQNVYRDLLIFWGDDNIPTLWKKAFRAATLGDAWQAMKGHLNDV